MSCRALCLTCKAAGLKACPFVAGAPLPLVEAEKPKVIYRGRILLSPGGHLTFSRIQNPDSWDEP
jgi:hypothetical protein